MPAQIAGGGGLPVREPVAGFGRSDAYVGAVTALCLAISRIEFGRMQPDDIAGSSPACLPDLGKTEHHRLIKVELA